MAPMNEAVVEALECRRVGVAYGETAAISALDLTVASGETVALLGPSGSGKTTLLYAIAGFLPLASGEIRMAGQLVASTSLALPPEKRSVGMVFQHYGLWPHLDALETVAYPLRRSGLAAGPARAEAKRLLVQMQIDHLAQRHPDELSGGEQQRVGLARALARHPSIYLLDEPTAHLDTALKTDLRAELHERMHTDGAAAIQATHDVEEALAVADRVVLLRDGSVVQIGTPEEIYARPVDEWAAQLTGPASFLADDIAGAEATGMASHADGPGRLLVRPDWVTFDGPIRATVREVRYHGTHTDYQLETRAGDVLLRHPGPPIATTGTATSCKLSRVWRTAASA